MSDNITKLAKAKKQYIDSVNTAASVAQNQYMRDTQKAMRKLKKQIRKIFIKCFDEQAIKTIIETEVNKILHRGDN